MSASTNSLVAATKRFGIPAGAAATVLLGLTCLFGHNSAHAASSTPPPLDNSSIAPLVSLDDAVEAVAARVTPAVVNVSVTSRASADESAEEDGQGSGSPQGVIPPGFQWFFGQQGPMQGMKPSPQIEHGIGSGVIISPDGYILTNDHVVDGALQIRVTMDDRRVFPAKLIGVDKLNDLAVIKIRRNRPAQHLLGRLFKIASRPDRARLRQPLRLLPILRHARHCERPQSPQSILR